MLVLHIRSLSSDSLANIICSEQKVQNWPGLAKKIKIICEELYIEDCNSTTIDRNRYKSLLLAACHRSNENSLHLLAKGKCERIANEEYGKIEYFRHKKYTISDSNSEPDLASGHLLEITHMIKDLQILTGCINVRKPKKRNAISLQASVTYREVQ